VKRSEALAILSRDHHQALVVAQKLTRAGSEADAAAAQQRFLNFWHPDGRHHFQLEEELLFPAYAAHGDPYHPLLLRVLGDHVAIRARAGRLSSDHIASTEELHELGKALAEHVRREERELFELIEAAIPPDELLQLAHALERAGAS